MIDHDELVISKGDTVTMRPVFGMGAPIDVVVTDIGLHEMNDEKIFEYVGPDGHDRWAYYHQLDAVIPANEDVPAPKL